ncbi:hypothetical protein FRC17_010049 [Serendipita sp. 399]|nr:hypothetical protein FRC17_010049 [Serendipita sp. 399]
MDQGEIILQQQQQQETSNAPSSSSVNNDAASTMAVPQALDPVPMSFPAMLLNPKQRAPHLSARLRELEMGRPSKLMTTMIDGKTRGKRRIRRFDNVTFHGNPHIVTPARSDYQVSRAQPSETFPIPLPSYLPRVSPAPSGAVLRRSEPFNLNSAYAGRFTLGLRGVKTSTGEMMMQRQTHLLRPNSRRPDPSMAALYTPTATDLESSIVDTEGSDYGGLADSISSLQIVESSEALPAGVGGVATVRIEEETEASSSDAESAFSIIDRPGEAEEEEEANGGDTTIQASGGEGNIQDSRPPRPMERNMLSSAAGMENSGVLVHHHHQLPNGTRMHVRSESSPSRSPMSARARRPSRRRHGLPRRVVMITSSSSSSRCAAFQVEPPSTFMAYVYGQ